MYRIGVKREFVAQHFLTAGEPGPEHEWHSHRYRVEAVLAGFELDDAGYLVDLDRIRARLDRLVEHYRDRTLNELPEFEGRNPSLETFARILGERLGDAVDPGRIERVRIVLWEDDDAWVSWDSSPH